MSGLTAAARSANGVIVLGIPRYDISKDFCVYEVNVSYKEKEWSVYRRYSQFLELAASLRGVKHVEKLSFPKKTYSPNPKNPEFLSQRRADLERYLKALALIPEIRENADVVSFLGLNSASSAASPSHTEFGWVKRTGGGRSGGSSFMTPRMSNRGVDNPAPKDGNKFPSCSLL